jgi:transcriptional regulator with XRE-family HTH domain
MERRAGMAKRAKIQRIPRDADDAGGVALLDRGLPVEESETSESPAAAADGMAASERPLGPARLNQAMIQWITEDYAQLGWSKAELAERSGVNYPHLLQILKGRSPGSLDVWDRLFGAVRGHKVDTHFGFAAEVRAKCDQHGWSLADLATRSGLSYQYVMSIMRGDSRGSLPAWDRMMGAGYLGNVELYEWDLGISQPDL